MTETHDQILDHIQGLEIIDTHEHLPAWEAMRERPTDVLREYLTNYIVDDLMSSGLSQADLDRVRDISLPLMERWDIVEPHWEMCRHTGYGRSTDLAARGVHGVDGFRRGTIEKLNESFQRSLEPGHFRRVLRDLSKIRISVLDSSLDHDPELFRSVHRLDAFIYPRTMDGVELIEHDLGIRICSFDDWLDACEADMERALARGAVALKCALAYDRSLRFDRVTYAEAEEEFNALFKLRHLPTWGKATFTLGTAFQDFMMHHVLRLANRRGLTYQFHTGHFAGNGNHTRNGDPTLMTNLFIEYPDVDFSLFHISYPYQQAAASIAKCFPNVFLDMCWGHIISPTAAVNALAEWIDAVPVNKTSGFGGDFSVIDQVYGHQMIARQNIARALTRKVDEGVFDINRAKEISELLLIENPIRILKLDGKI